MEIVLDRRLSEARVYPAIDIEKSGTRREELLLPNRFSTKSQSSGAASTACPFRRRWSGSS